MVRNVGPPRCYLLPAHTQQEGTQDPRQKGGPAGGPGGRGCAPGALRDQERLVRPGSPSCHPDPGRADTLGREWGQALAPRLQGPPDRGGEALPSSAVISTPGLSPPRLTSGPRALSSHLHSPGVWSGAQGQGCSSLAPAKGVRDVGC